MTGTAGPVAVAASRQMISSSSCTCDGCAFNGSFSVSVLRLVNREILRVIVGIFLSSLKFEFESKVEIFQKPSQVV
jgi:hypothetical protein